MVAGVSDSDRRVTPPAGTHNHTQLLTWASMAARCWTWALVVLASRLPLFDSSPTVLLPGVGWFTASLLRWDTFHYARIALRGYEYEYQWAHFPGTPVVMRGVGHIIHTLKRRSIDASLPWDEILLGGSSFIMMLASSRTLYDLSLHHLKSHHLAFVTSVLSLLPSSPVTLLLAPGAEPFFTFLSYRGEILVAVVCAFSHVCQGCYIVLENTGGGPPCISP
jgi:phosphatidylinositol glycan class V